nr:hypothetical protein [Cupriavidus malaysiensis]
MLYRTNLQLASAFRQALKGAVEHFTSEMFGPNAPNWQQAIANNVPGVYFYGGPMEASLPGKSGDLIVRYAAQTYGFRRQHPGQLAKLTSDERFFLVDDGLYTGDQLVNYIDRYAPFMKEGGQSAVVVAIAHEQGIAKFTARFPNIPVFAGEILKSEHGFVETALRWKSDGLWPHQDCEPLEVYLDVHKRLAKFDDDYSLGFGSLGLTVVYDHGVPDNSLQLFWDESATWTPLRER